MRARGLDALLGDLRAAGATEASTVAEMLEEIAANGGDQEEAGFLVTCLEELKGWAESAICSLKEANGLEVPSGPAASRVVIEVSGGVAKVTSAPPGIEVVIIDPDNEG